MFLKTRLTIKSLVGDLVLFLATAQMSTVPTLLQSNKFSEVFSEPYPNLEDKRRRLFLVINVDPWSILATNVQSESADPFSSADTATEGFITQLVNME